MFGDQCRCRARGVRGAKASVKLPWPRALGLGTERAGPAPACCAVCLLRDRAAGQPKDQCLVWAPVPLTRVAAERPVVRLVAAGAALAVVADFAQVMPYLPQSGDWVPVG
jgi:hypothetical protein